MQFNEKEKMIIKRKIKIFLVSFFFVLMLNLVGCGLNIQPKGVNQPVPLPHIPSKISKVEQTLVKFLVQTPFTDFENVEIALDLLDDLSGYHDNIRRYPMKDIGDNRFEVSVLLDNQFDVRYRYTMISPAEVPETNLYGKTVDFRMAIVEPDLTVSDTVFNWANSNLGLAIGHLNGFMIDHQTQAGIPDMMINIAGMKTFTDMTGYFSFEKIPVGEYNLVAYAVDGHYPPLQQMTVIAEGQTTKIDISLQPLKKVTVHFQVTPSSETVGVPIRLAGNFVGLGAHYGSDFITSGSAASLMPLLDQVDSDIYTIDLELYAGSAFKYRYTLGDGYVNAERSDERVLVTRQFIVPSKSTSVKDSIITWGVDESLPFTIQVEAPVNTPPNEYVSIQIYRKHWNNPIPMWHVTSNKWMFLLYGNGQTQDLDIRFCRNDNCDIAYDEESFITPVTLNFSDAGEKLFQINQWHNWDDTGVLIYEKTGDGLQNKLNGIELKKGVKSSELPYLLSNLTEIRENGINWLVIRPSWDVYLDGDLPVISSSRESLMFNELAYLCKQAKEKSMRVSIYPELSFPTNAEEFWSTATRNEAWWQRWYQEYAHFINNFSIFASQSNIDHLIVGENNIRFSYPDTLEADEEKLGTPDYASETWSTMLGQIRNNYSGTLLWASLVNDLPEYSFLDLIDGYYLLQNHSDETFDSASLNQHIQAMLKPYYEKNQKPIYIGLNFPALSEEAMTYTDHSEPLITPLSDGDSYLIDLNNQAYLYSDFTCSYQALNWISGISTRGFNLALHLTDISSSIYGKPAMNEFLKCMYKSQ